MGRKWANIVAKKTAKDGANSKVYAEFDSGSGSPCLAAT